jgi:glycosyltransferase involved in cell wall biosynthesis
VRFDLLLPTFVPGDAVGNHVLRLAKVLQQLGEVRIYSEHIDQALGRQAAPIRHYEPASDSLAIYQVSIGSGIPHRLLRSKARIALDYHNITPMLFYIPYEPHIASLLVSGRLECGALSDRAELAIAHSQYSATELEGMGFSKILTIPVLLDLESHAVPPDAGLVGRLAASKAGADILFVGRISPNKRQEDVIKAFTVFKRYFDKGARLHLVGPSSSDGYHRTLERFVEKLGIADVYLTGPVSQPELIAYYQSADLFLSMSEHEGFCVPLIEAMKSEVPVIAYAAAAVPETIGEAGILVYEKRYEEIAALMHLVMSDGTLRERMIVAGRARAEFFRAEVHERAYLEVYSSLGL